MHTLPAASVISRYQFIERLAATEPVQSLCRQRYSTRRLRAELRAEERAAGRYALRSWLHRRGWRALSTRPQRPRATVADPEAVVAENLLLNQPTPTAPNQVWVGYICKQLIIGCY